MRVYLPMTVASLSTLRDKGLQPMTPGNAVTPALREWYIEGDADELEYAALADAAQASLRQVEPAGPLRRVVVAVELPDAWVRAPHEATGGPPSSVEVTHPVTVEHVVSVHVDDVAAEADVAAAVQALPAADAGEDDAQFVVDAVDDHELLWYDVTELDDVLSSPH